MAATRITLAATGAASLGDVAPDSVGTWVVHISGTWVGSLVPKGYVAGNGLTASDAAQLGYRPPDSSTLVDPGSTAITANGVYLIPCDGLFCLLDWTRTSGSLVIDAVPVRG